jgi:hypothetical protein
VSSKGCHSLSLRTGDNAWRHNGRPNVHLPSDDRNVIAAISLGSFEGDKREEEARLT